jgi:hypothetical protein
MPRGTQEKPGPDDGGNRLAPARGVQSGGYPRLPGGAGTLPGLNRALRVPSTARHGPVLLLPDDGGNTGRVDAVEVKMQPAG